MLELGASDTIDIKAAITVGNGGGLILGDATDNSLAPQFIKIGADIGFTGSSAGSSSEFVLNPNSIGTWELDNHATVSFTDTNYGFYVNGTQFTLIGDAATLTSDLASNPNSYYALANNIDASGTTHSAALAGTFTGVFEGFNHTIDALTINDSTNTSVGMFNTVSSTATVQDLALTKLSITSTVDNAYVGGLAGQSAGIVKNTSVAGTVAANGNSADVGGLVGDNSGTVEYSSVSSKVAGGAAAIVGGLVGKNSSIITASFASGAASGGASATVGGVVGNTSSNIVQSLSTAYVTGGSGANVGGFAGNNSGTISNSYFDTDTSGTTTNVGSNFGTTSATGKSTATLQAALPSGLDSTIWAINPGNSYPYLINAFSGTPEVISGTAYSDTGTTALGSTSSGLVTIGVLLDGTNIGNQIAGANGYYYEAVQPGTLSGTQQLFAYLSGNTVKANTYIQNPSADVTNADLYGNTLRILSGASTMSSVFSGLSTAIGSNSGSDFLYGGSGISADTTQLELSTTSGFAIDQAVNAGTGTLIIDASGAVTQSAAVTAANLALRGSSASYTLTTSTNSVGTLAANTGAVSLADSGDLSVGTVNGLSGVTSTGAVTLTGANLTIASGARIAAGSGDNVVLSATGNFVNSEGSDAIAVSGNGRWLIYSSAPGGDTFGSLDSSNTAIWDATYSTLAPGSVSQSGNRYLFAYQPTLTFTSTNASKTYGSDGTSTIASAYSISGYQSGVTGAYLGNDASSVFSGAPSLNSSAADVTASVNGGPYAIAIATGTLSALNGYALAFASTGTLSVTARPITVTADSLSRLYGDSNPAFTYTVGGDGLVNGDTLSGGLATTASTSSNVGSYAIGQGTLAASSNYTLTYTGGTLSVTARPISVTADNLSRLYGDSNPAFTYTVSGDGLVNGDTLSGGLATTAAATSDVGSYAMARARWPRRRTIP